MQSWVLSFLWIEITMAIFIFCGKTPCSIDKLNIWLIETENNLLNSFKHDSGCWKGPQIFLCQDFLYSLLLLLRLLDIKRYKVGYKGFFVVIYQIIIKVSTCFDNFFVNFSCNGCEVIIKMVAYFNGIWGDFSFIYVQRFYVIMFCFRFEIYETFYIFPNLD